MNEPADAQSRLLTPLWILAGAVLVAGMYVGREFLVPIAFAVLLNIVCRPLVRWMHRRIHIPPAIGAAVIVMTLVGVIATSCYFVAGPIQRWWEGAPDQLAAAQQRLQNLGGPLRKLNDLKERMDQFAAPADAPAGTPAGTTQPSPVVPVAAQPNPAMPGFVVTIFGGVSSLVSGLTEVLFLTFLLLSADGLFVRKLRTDFKSVEDKHAVSEVVHEAEKVVLRYLVVTFTINVAQAIVVGITMKLLGLPHPLLWALLTVVIEFIPYLGAAVMVLLLSATAITTFDSLGHAALIPAAYIVISMLQNNIVSPLLYGNHLKLNAVAILVGVIFFWFVWGIPGAFVAVPILAILSIATEKSERWHALGRFLAD